MAINRFTDVSRILAAAALGRRALPVTRPVRRPLPCRACSDPRSGQPVSGAQVLRFSLYSSPTGGTPLQENQQTVDVSQGVFSASPGFDPQLFGMRRRWLEIGVRTGPGEFETLTPRQRIGAAPFAL